MTTTMRKLFAACTFAAVSVACQAAYPDKPIRLIVPFQPGGSTDVVARIVARQVEKQLGQPIVIENRGGAGSVIGSDVVAKSAPDGYTLLVTHTGFAVNASLIKKLPYNTLSDFTPIALMADHPGVLVAAVDKPFNSFDEFMKYAKSKPGVAIYSSSGNGAWPHLAMETLSRHAGVKMVHVAYNGAGPARSDLVAGRVDVKIEAYATTRELVKAGRLKVLAVTSKTRMPELPDVPTIAERGYPQYESSLWIGVVGPARLPPEVSAKLERAFVTAAREPTVIEQLNQQSIRAHGLPGADLQALTKTEVERSGKLVRELGLQE